MNIVSLEEYIDTLDKDYQAFIRDKEVVSILCKLYELYIIREVLPDRVGELFIPGYGKVVDILVRGEGGSLMRGIQAFFRVHHRLPESEEELLSFLDYAVKNAELFREGDTGLISDIIVVFVEQGLKKLKDYHFNSILKTAEFIKFIGNLRTLNHGLTPVPTKARLLTMKK